MKTSNFRIVPLRTEIAEGARRAAGKGAPDHRVVTADSPRGYPCRHCLRWAKPGDRIPVSLPEPFVHLFDETGLTVADNSDWRQAYLN